MQEPGAFLYAVGKVQVRTGLADPAAPVMTTWQRCESPPAVTLAIELVPQPEVSAQFPVAQAVPVMDAEPNEALTEPPPKTFCPPSIQFPKIAPLLAITFELCTNTVAVPLFPIALLDAPWFIKKFEPIMVVVAPFSEVNA